MLKCGFKANAVIFPVVLLFGRKNGEVTGRQRKLRNVELHDLCSSPNVTVFRAIRSNI